MICPICKKNRIIIHSSGGEIVGMDCLGEYPPCRIIKPGSEIFTIIKAMLYLIEDSAKRRADLTKQYQLDLRDEYISCENGLIALQKNLDIEIGKPAGP